jgi:type IV pilus assembly protein PilB
MLVEGGLLTEEQLQHAIVNQKRTNLKLGQYLVREGVLSGSQIIDQISKQFRVRKYTPDKYPLDMELARVIPVEMPR